MPFEFARKKNNQGGTHQSSRTLVDNVVRIRAVRDEPFPHFGIKSGMDPKKNNYEDVIVPGNCIVPYWDRHGSDG
jgi:hypothetical protein